uniref:C2 domain-containing protein n=1 Tax=Peronospora matthiolae TaxID=2874970 RepID=A0AAV1UNV1_9STRA
MYAAAASPLGAVRAPTSSIELSIRATNLKDRDIISKSDPFAVLYVKNGGMWTTIGRTEAKKDDLNPVWTKLFLVEFHFESVQHLKVEVYDQDSSSPDKLKDQDFIGSAEFTLGQLMGAEGQSGSFWLTRGTSTANRQGSLLVKAEEAKVSSETVRLCFCATGLANMDGLFGKSDPFLVISRLREDDGSWTQVYRTETIDNNLNPKWRRFEVPLQQLCNGEYKRPLLLQVLDEDRGGKSELIGLAQTTLEEILGKHGVSFVLHNEALQKKKGKRYTNAGLLVAAEAGIFRDHTFIDYLRGGMEMNLIIGIDYTASNGPPNDPRSLHFIDPRGPNQYQHAISSTVSILQEYDVDKQFPVYGFGGIPPGAHTVDHCFPLNLNPSNPEVAGSQGVLQLYTSSLGHIRLHGPTFFAPLINQSMQIAKQLSDPRKQKYFVLLIITDGEIMDMQKTIEALVEASHVSPLSIVIIGVGPADFSSMVALDGDGGKLRASNGRISARDIVQFVPYNRFVHHPDALARETLAEIPRQLCQYMKVCGAAPKPALPPAYRLFPEPSTCDPTTSSSFSEPSAAALTPGPQPHLAQGALQEHNQGYPVQGQPQGYPVQGQPQGYPVQGQPQGHSVQGQPQGYQQYGNYSLQQGQASHETSRGYQQQMGLPPQRGSFSQESPQQYQQQGTYPPRQGYPAQGTTQGYEQQGSYPPQQGYPAQGPPRGAAPGYPGYRG